MKRKWGGGWCKIVQMGRFFGSKIRVGSGAVFGFFFGKIWVFFWSSLGFLLRTAGVWGKRNWVFFGKVWGGG